MVTGPHIDSSRRFCRSPGSNRDAMRRHGSDVNGSAVAPQPYRSKRPPTGASGPGHKLDEKLARCRSGAAGVGKGTSRICVARRRPEGCQLPRIAPPPMMAMAAPSVRPSAYRAALALDVVAERRRGAKAEERDEDATWCNACIQSPTMVWMLAEPALSVKCLITTSPAAPYAPWAPAISPLLGDGCAVVQVATLAHAPIIVTYLGEHRGGAGGWPHPRSAQAGLAIAAPKDGLKRVLTSVSRSHEFLFSREIGRH